MMTSLTWSVIYTRCEHINADELIADLENAYAIFYCVLSIPLASFVKSIGLKFFGTVLL